MIQPIETILIVSVTGHDGMLVRFEPPGPRFWCWLHELSPPSGDSTIGRKKRNPVLLSADAPMQRIAQAIVELAHAHCSPDASVFGSTLADKCVIYRTERPLASVPPIFESWPCAVQRMQGALKLTWSRSQGSRPRCATSAATSRP